MAKYRIMQEIFADGSIRGARYWVEVAKTEYAQEPTAGGVNIFPDGTSWHEHIPIGQTSKYCSLDVAKAEIARLQSQDLIGKISVYQEFE